MTSWFLKVEKSKENLLFKDNCELSNHLLENLKPFVRVVTRPANKIITNTIKEVKAVEPNFQKDFFEELNIPKYKGSSSSPFSETIQQLLKPLKEEVDKHGGLKQVETNFIEMKKQQEEAIAALTSIIKETKEKLKL
jgi:hypothetical protein